MIEKAAKRGDLGLVPVYEKMKAKLQNPRVTIDDTTETNTTAIPPVIQGEFTCKFCGKVCKNKLGLGAHLRSHKII